MSYHDFLASRGYRRLVIETTLKQPGDVVLRRLDLPVERVPEETRVVALRKRRRA